MYQTRPISELQVIGIRYWETQAAENDDCCVSSYLEAGIFSSTGAPFHFIEPKFPEERRLPQEVDNLAIFNGIVAEVVPTLPKNMLFHCRRRLQHQPGCDRRAAGSARRRRPYWAGLV